MVDSTKVIFDCPLPPWLVGAAAAVVLVVVVVFERRDAGHLRGLVRRGILALVALATLLLAGLVLNPKVIRTWPDPHKPLCSVLVDGSRSMLLADTYSGELLKWLDSRLPRAETAPHREVARADLVHALLDPAPERWVAKLGEGFELAGWRFAGETAALPLGQERPAYEVDAEGYTTALGEALEAAGRGSGDRHPRAVVLLSDGAWNTGRDPTEIARVLGRLGVPVFVVGLGNPSPPRDASVVAARAPRSVLLGDEVQITAEVATTGMGAMRLPVQLLSSGDVVAEKTVVTLPGGRPVSVSFSFVPDVPGRRTLTIQVPAQENEQDESNNVAKTTIEVAERQIRVLLVDNEPRWEFRFIRNVFERDPAVEIKVTLLRPRIGPIKGDGYVSSLPTEKKALADFDLVVLGDVPRESLPDDFLKELADLVKIRGGSLIVVAGRRRRLRGLLDTPVGSILPVSLDGSYASDGHGGPFRLELTQDGATHLVTRLAADPEENETLWSRLPKMRWSASVAGLARGATALVVHPYRLAGASKLPLVAVQRVGAGKVMYLGIEGTWRWRKAVGDKYHYRFWAQAVRWMVKKQFAKGDPRARLSLDRTECDVGEPVEVEAYCLGPDGFPLERARVWVKIQLEDGAAQRLALAPVQGGWGIYRAAFKPEAPGKYAMRPIVSVYGEQPLDSTVALTATRPDLENKFLAQDANALSSIAQASGGRYLKISEIDTLPSLLAAKVERRILTAEHSPCRHWAYYGALALLLGTAWLIRKRSGLA